MPRKEKTYHFIYKTTNLINEKYYIGMHSTNNLNDGYIGSGKRLWYSINKYGKENFNFEIIKFLPNKDLLKEEEKNIVNENLLKNPKCMNLRVGGIGGFSNEQQKINNEKSLKKQKFLWDTDKEWSDKIKLILGNNSRGNKSFSGRNHSEISKEKIGKTNSVKQKGLCNSQFGTCWITNGKDNKKIKKEEQIPNDWKLGRK